MTFKSRQFVIKTPFLGGRCATIQREPSALATTSSKDADPESERGQSGLCRGLLHSHKAAAQAAAKHQQGAGEAEDREQARNLILGLLLFVS